jgi:hypothetical protein
MTTKKDGSGSNTTVVAATAPVKGTLEPLPEIANFRQWTERLDVKALDALIPSLQSRAATAPAVDGIASPGEYTGEVIDLSTRWEGTPATPEDISGSAQLTFTDDAIYAYISVTDDVLGSILRPDDCKRPRRNDNIEFPRGNSANTSTVFNVALFPITDDPANGNPPCYARERDNRQGPGPETAPGVEIASIVSDPYVGYTFEVKIPFDVLPDTIDPNHMGLQILINDSDTQDLTGQTRVGWSTWAGVRADPWRWGIATLPGYPSQPSAPKEPVIPATAARSVESPQTLLQSSRDGVAPGGWAALPAGTVRIDRTEVTPGAVRVEVKTKQAGTLRAFVWDGKRTLASTLSEVGKGSHTIVLPIETAVPAGSMVLVSYEVGEATAAAARALN